MNELFLQFKLNGMDIEVERAQGILSFKASRDGADIPLEVEESIQCKMYKFNINKDKCIVAFDEDDICLHVITEKGKEYIYYSLDNDDTKLYTIDEIKEQYKEKCEENIEELVLKFDKLIKDISKFYKVKQVKFNKIKTKLGKDIEALISLYYIKLHSAEYINEVREATQETTENAKRIEKLYVEKLMTIVSPSTK